LAVALGLAGVLNLALAASFGYAELLTPGMRSGLWLVLGLAWVGFGISSFGWDASPLESQKISAVEDTLPSALDYYLKGNWFQAERLLRRRLEVEPRDLDARLTLGTLLRHTRRYAEAKRELDLLERLEGSQKWVWEIQKERELLATAEDEQTVAEKQAATGEAGPQEGEMAQTSNADISNRGMITAEEGAAEAA
jgi:uncharacterized protein HemY